jgi:hypothetical protein
VAHILPQVIRLPPQLTVLQRKIKQISCLAQVLVTIYSGGKLAAGPC